MSLPGNESRDSLVTRDHVRDAIRTVKDPDFDKDLVELGQVTDIEVGGGKVALTLVLTTPADPARDALKTGIEAAVGALDGVSSVDVTVDAVVPAATALLAKNSVPGVKNIIAVSSGKGGVGKSTVSVNLAIALAQSGAQVGILDADVYGPNVPIMLGLSGQPQGEGGKIVPLEIDGLRVMSMAFLVAEDQPVIWRGPMLHSAMKQFLFDVVWGELDYLVVDLPPGTGDAQLSLAQQSHLMGSVIVTTPQDVSVLDVKKAISMFKQVNVPVLGVVENMAGMAITGFVEGGASTLTIETSEGPVSAEVAGDGSFAAEINVFGAGGGRKIAELFGVPLVGNIPLDPSIRAGGDSGRPVTVARPDSVVARRFKEVAGRIAKTISVTNVNNSAAISV